MRSQGQWSRASTEGPTPESHYVSFMKKVQSLGHSLLHDFHMRRLVSNKHPGTVTVQKVWLNNVKCTVLIRILEKPKACLVLCEWSNSTEYTISRRPTFNHTTWTQKNPICRKHPNFTPTSYPHIGRLRPWPQNFPVWSLSFTTPQSLMPGAGLQNPGASRPNRLEMTSFLRV